MRLRERLLAVGLAVAACTSPKLPGSIGVVATRDAKNGRIVVVEVPPGSAGARAGLEVGDEIVAVEGVPVAEMTAGDFHRAVRGPVGSRVVVRVRRDGVLRDLAVERAALRETSNAK